MDDTRAKLDRLREITKKLSDLYNAESGASDEAAETAPRGKKAGARKAASQSFDESYESLYAQESAIEQTLPQADIVKIALDTNEPQMLRLQTIEILNKRARSNDPILRETNLTVLGALKNDPDALIAFTAKMFLDERSSASASASAQQKTPKPS